MAGTVLLATCSRCGKKNRIPISRLRQSARCGSCKSPLPQGVWESETPVQVDDITFDGLVGRSLSPVLVDFWAPWCAPCRIMEPVLEQLARKHVGELIVAKLNVDQSPTVASRFGITSIPTMILFQHGRPLDQMVGAVPAAQLEGRIARHLASTGVRH